VLFGFVVCLANGNADKKKPKAAAANKPAKVPKGTLVPHPSLRVWDVDPLLETRFEYWDIQLACYKSLLYLEHTPTHLTLNTCIAQGL